MAEKTKLKNTFQDREPVKKKKIILCKDCQNLVQIQSGDYEAFNCLSDKAPHTDFVTGRKVPRFINTDGQCKFFTSKS